MKPGKPVMNIVSSGTIVISKVGMYLQRIRCQLSTAASTFLANQARKTIRKLARYRLCDSNLSHHPSKLPDTPSSASTLFNHSRLAKFNNHFVVSIDTHIARFAM